MRKITTEEVDKAIMSDEVIRACPAVVAQVTETAADPEATARDLARIISTDEAISAKVLKLVNSAFYGMSGEVSTVTQATIIMGMREILSLVYSIPAGSVFRSSRDPHMERVWEHSVFTAATARELAYLLKYELPEEVFVAGVIHDVGKPIISSILGEEYSVLVEETGKQGIDLEQAERTLIGIPHTVAGRRLLKEWHFPKVLQDAVFYHHHPVVDGEVKIVPGIVYVANQLAKVSPDASFGVVLSGMLAEVVSGLNLTRRAVAEAYTRAMVAYEDLKLTFKH